jgi:putative glutamine amidotransferase
MSVHIALPEPTALDHEYNQRSLEPYLFALKAAGATPILIPLPERQDRIARVLTSVQGILLPGSRYDVDPERYNEARQPECNPADPARAAVDELLLQDAFNLQKPIFGICQGMQMLNVWLNGTLTQHLTTPVNHRPGREFSEAHTVEILEGTRLSTLLPIEATEEGKLKVNSSHHQAINVLGDNLRLAAISPIDQVVEAVELRSAEHFVLGVQWHPERSYSASAASRAIFAAFFQAAACWQPRVIEESVAS